MSLEPCIKCADYNLQIAQAARKASIAQDKGKPVQAILDTIASLKDSRDRCTSEGHYSSMVASREGRKRYMESRRQDKFA